MSIEKIILKCMKRLILKILVSTHKNKEIYKELMPVAWHPLRPQDWHMPGDKKKEIEKM